ncbi:MAG: hypothetical protein U0575_02210 [Phycisphaerales bacterium]
MRYLTIRDVPKELAAAIDAERKRGGESLNRTVLRLLARALGVGARQRRSNGLARFSGGWTDDELRRFEDATAGTRGIDAELWR